MELPQQGALVCPHCRTPIEGDFGPGAQCVECGINFSSGGFVPRLSTPPPPNKKAWYDIDLTIDGVPKPAYIIFH